MKNHWKYSIIFHELKLTSMGIWTNSFCGKAPCVKLRADIAGAEESDK